MPEQSTRRGLDDAELLQMERFFMCLYGISKSNLWQAYCPFKVNLIEGRRKVGQKNEASCLEKRNVLFYCQNRMNGECHV